LPNNQYPYLKAQKGYGTYAKGEQRFNNKYLILPPAYAFILFSIWREDSSTTSKQILTIVTAVMLIAGVIYTEWRERRRPKSGSSV
jgi:hypothetical protein